ncbi:zinc transport system substrate-binding protein [Natronoarchaeum philippinense]|uniref:Zinc transport system substrate-binding protein n=1 Tax=Natronoarchaeum philippinense TaxID=558529 RepID=A0A285MZZ4_NATPI|nr:zinc ABC transporter substrate-binding protein [Natronoarchaeum philippinense]SNZ02752.1 zinc transport system substrate-binding protein [Natronoarchaeum philippinense]
MNTTRRDILTAGAGALTTGALAGCTDALNLDSSPGSGVEASFYLLYDFADQIVGDETNAESIVPFGQHGHGWQPSGQVQKGIYQSAAFVYMGEGFQPWADDIVNNLRADDAGVTVVPARHGIELLGTNASHEEEHGNESGDDGHDHGHGTGDPHFWLDPMRAKQAVDNIRDGLIKAVPDAEDAFSENATAYKSEIDDLHESYQSRLSGGDQSHVLVAGHNAFQYTGARYGFTVHALSGISPDDTPSNQAISEAQETIAEHDIEYVLTPAMESDRAAEQLVENTDASEYLTISALSGMKEEWIEQDWGYIDVMRNVNLNTFEKALGAA